MRTLDYKDRIQQQAEELAAKDDKDYWDLEEPEQFAYYEAAARAFEW